MSSITPIRSEEWESFYILYDCSNDETEYGCLQKDILIKAIKLENFIKNQEKWDSLCMAKSEEDLSCNPEYFMSALSMFDNLE